MIEWFLHLDGAILIWLQEFVRQDWLTPAVKLYTHLGDKGCLWILLCAVLLCFPKTRRVGMAGAFALCFSLLCTNCVLKPLVHRTRPWFTVEGLTPLIFEGDLRSFPSGHTSSAFAAGTALFRLLSKRRERYAVILLAVLMGLSRLYVGVHYPSDVLCGAIVGTFCGWAGVRVLNEIEKKHGTQTD